MTEEEVRQMVRDRVAELGIRGLARDLGINSGFVSVAVNGSYICPALWKALGLRKVVSYEKEGCNALAEGA